MQHGNVIELSTGQVGIDDACTGVRSLQATFMVALFFGEFYRMRFWRRALLVVAGGAIAFVCNIGRTFLLCEVAANSGIAAIHRWHDPAGFTILVICLFALWGLSMWLKPAPCDDSVRCARMPAVAGISGSWLVECAHPLDLPHRDRRRSLVCADRGAKNGQRIVERRLADERAGLSPRTDFRAAVETLLRYNEGGAATWRSADDRRWMMYSFRWLPGRTAALFVKNHRPDICLPASGLTMEQAERRSSRYGKRRQPADSLLSLR